MMKYELTLMSPIDYDRYMSDGPYNATIFTIPANSEQDAIDWAHAVHTGSVVARIRSEKELAEIAKANHDNALAAEMERKHRETVKRSREERKAMELGITVEEYHKMENRKRYIQRLNNEIAKLEKELDSKKRKLEELILNT